jgi:hypothetical protein
MLYSQNIKNIVSGISQQPPLLRLPEQLEEQINGLSTEAGGLQKRPPSIFVKNISPSLSATQKPLMHFVNRDEKERYIMYFHGDNLKIFGLDGTQKTVRIADDPDYLKTDNPRRDLRIITIADHTFILNRNVKVKMTPKKTPDYFHTQGALVHIKQGQYGRTYKIWVDDALVASHDTPDGSDKSHTRLIDTNYIASQLAAKATAAGRKVDSGNTWLRIQGCTKVATQDGFNNQAMIGTVGHIQKFSLLPETAPDGYVVEVAGDPGGSSAGSYYVKYNAAEGVWKECAAPNLEIEIDPATMPHALVREADGTFTFERKEWAERKIGDDDSNPLPSFIGQTLNDIFFYRNRLGVLAGENIILSESAEYFNFWMTTANDILDTDCIDVPTSTTRINILNYAVPFNQSLYCFSDTTQFMLSADTVLSPKNCALIEVTGFNSSPSCRPVVAGKNLYFPAERAEYTSIKEYYNVQDVADIKNAQDITAHVASYIPNGVYQILPNTNENILLFLTEGEPDAIYVYKYLFLNEQRIQASWSKWKMKGRIYGIFFICSTLYILLDHSAWHSLEKIDFTYNTKDFPEEPYRVLLDSKKILETGKYDPIRDHTLYSLVNEYNGSIVTKDTTLAYVLPDGKYHVATKEECPNGYKLYIPGNWQDKPVVCGIPYTFRITLGTLYIRQEDSKGNYRALTNGRLQIRTIEMNYADTGAFRAYVKSHGHTYTYTMANKRLGEMTFGDISFATGTFRIPVQAQNTDASIAIESDMPLPVSLIGYLWKGSFIPKTKGV